MTIIASDEWHIVEVSSGVIDLAEWGGIPLRLDEAIQYELRVHHEDKCPYEDNVIWCNAHESDIWSCEDDEKSLDCLHEKTRRYLCCLGSDMEFYGESDFIKYYDLGSGLWRLRGHLERDYHGEYDVQYDIEKLNGPVDEREFTEAE